MISHVIPCSPRAERRRRRRISGSSHGRRAGARGGGAVPFDLSSTSSTARAGYRFRPPSVPRLPIRVSTASSCFAPSTLPALEGERHRPARGADRQGRRAARILRGTRRAFQHFRRRAASCPSTARAASCCRPSCASMPASARGQRRLRRRRPDLPDLGARAGSSSISRSARAPRPRHHAAPRCRARNERRAHPRAARRDDRRAWRRATAGSMSTARSAAAATAAALLEAARCRSWRSTATPRPCARATRWRSEYPGPAHRDRRPLRRDGAAAGAASASPR